MTNNKITSKGNFLLKYGVKISILSAIAVIVMLFEIPLFFAPSFYELDLSEIFVLLGGFAMGPLASVLIEFFKILLNLIINGTTTVFIGELANFITGCSLVLPATIIYKYNKSIKGALVGLLAGTLSLTVVGSMMNYFVLVPAYSVLYNLPLESIIQMGSAVNPLICDLKTLIAFAVVPFNLLKGVVCSIVCMLLYKRVSKILHK